MDLISILKAAIMGIVEGLTEFLPISSTGHLILAGSLLDFTGETVKVFEIVIQSGAMLAVIWQYRERLRHTLFGLAHDPVAQRFTRNLLIAFMPAGVLGLLFGGWVKRNLFEPVPVATAFIVGGLVILWVERRHRARYGARDLEGARHARVEAIDRRLEDASQTLGANGFWAFTTITLPLALPGIIAGAMLGFAKALGEFGATLTFVSNIPGETQTISREVARSIYVVDMN